MADLADTIRGIPLFSGLSREDIAKILGKLEEKSFAAGTTIFSQGEKGDSFYIMQSGAVQVMLESAGGRREGIAVLGPQDWFGEMALLSGEPRVATIVTIKDTTVWRLTRESWDELIEKHPIWLLHFCATLSKRLAHTDQQFSKSQDAFNSLAQEFYGSRSPEQQRVFRLASLLRVIDFQTADRLLETEGARGLVADLEKSHFPLIRPLENDRYELQGFFKDFLREKLLEAEGSETEQKLHSRLSEQYELLGDWEGAIHHSLEAQEWPRATQLLIAQQDELLNGLAAFVKNAVERIPPDYFFAEPHLADVKARALAHLGDFAGAVKTYKDMLSRRAAGTMGVKTVARYQKMADTLMQKGEYAQALHCLRSGLNLLGQELASADGDMDGLKPDQQQAARPAPILRRLPGFGPIWANLTRFSARSYLYSSVSQWLGGILGLATFAYLWFWTPDIGLEPAATKLLAILSLTLIYWIFSVFPDYGVALFFGLAIILSGLGKSEVVLGGFASSTWFMTLGVLGLGAGITGSGLFYRLSLLLVRSFPLKYYWQMIALGLTGIVVMALIPQQTARTAITSQMLVNLSESLGYKTPSRASTGLFAASFLGLGQLGFLFLTGSTTSLIAWGLLPNDVRAQFTWGYWCLAALPPTLVVVVIVMLGTMFLYRPESQAKVSYKMVETQLEVLGPLSSTEWITLIVLCFTVTGWLTTAYHGIDAAWISLISLCVLINTRVLGWGLLAKGWDLLIYMGVTLALPKLLTDAKIDQWLVEMISPVILPFLDNPALFFMIIALLTYALKLLLTSFMTVVTLSVALIPLSIDVGMSPWIIAMVILMASEVWFFPFQVDWHTLAYMVSEKKGFSYPQMCRINPIYAVAYIVALTVAIPYWRYLGLMG
jgi:anion transporter